MTKLACGSIDLSLDVQTSLAVPVQIVRKYSHFISTNNCSDNSLTSALRECDGIWDLDVDPLLKHTDNSDLIQACSSIEIFGNCVKQKVIPLCEKMEVASTHPSVHSYLSNALDVYKTICSQDLNAVSEAMCNKPDLLIAFMECGGIIDYRVVPFSDDPNDDVKLEIACRGVKEYKRCIFSRLNTVCQEKIIPMSNDITKYLRNYYNLYDWVCNATTTGEYCHTEELKQNLTKCVGLLNKEFDISVTGLDTDYFCTFLEDYKLCLSTRTSLACRKNEQAMRSPEIIYLTKDIVSKFMSLCNMIDIKECSRDIILEIIHKCKGFINYILIDSLQDSTDPLGMKEACRDISYYHHCVQSEVFKVCDVSSPVLQDQVIQEYMVGLTRNLSWVCDLNTKPENCTVKNILPYIAECQGFIEGIGDPHNLRKADSFGLNVACSFIQQYKECIDLNIRYVCREPKVLSEVSEISFYTQDLYYKYSWTCNKKKNGEICDTDKLLSHLEQCDVFLVHGVMPYVDSSFETLKYSYVCDALEDYRHCVVSKISRHCGYDTTIVQKSLIRQYLFDLYNKYKWICDKAHKIECTPQHLALHAKNCELHLNFSSAPHVGIHDQDSSILVCRGLHEYQSCLRQIYYNLCAYNNSMKPWNSTYLLSSKRIKNIEEACSRQKDPIGIDVCNTKVLNDLSHRCHGIVDTNLIPNVRKKNNSPKLHEACSALTQFQQCIHRNLGHCNTTAGLSKEVPQKYSWVCKETSNHTTATTCNETVLLEEMQECLGIMYFIVIPNAAMKKDQASLANACKGLKHYQNCVLSKTSNICANKILVRSTKVRRLTRHIMKRFSWTCNIQGQNQECKTHNIVEHLKTCLGFIDLSVTPNIFYPLDKDKMQMACSGLEDYQDCVDSKLYEMCAPLTKYFKRKDVKLFTELPSKYSWVCHTSHTHECTVENVMKSIKICKGLITTVLFAKLNKEEADHNQSMACRAMQSFELCTTVQVGKICRPDDIVLRHHNVRSATEEILNTYDWVCSNKHSSQSIAIVDAATMFRDNSCQQDLLRDKLKHCQDSFEKGIPVGVLNDKFVSRDLELTCRALQSYQTCSQLAQLELCSNHEESVKIVLDYSKVLYETYNWTCNVQTEAVCDEAFLSKSIPACLEILKNELIPHINGIASGKVQKAACEGYKHYKRCVKYIINSNCQNVHIDNAASHVGVLSFLTNKLSSSFQWSCNGFHCNGNQVISNIKKCTHILQELSSSFVKSARIDPCEKVLAYKKCIHKKMDLPCTLSNHLLQSKELEHYTDVLYSAFDEFCGGARSECDKEELLQGLYRCEEIISKQVQPYTMDRGNQYQSRLACRGLSEYKWCVTNVKALLHCKNEDELENEGDIDKLIIAIEEKYNWTCEENSKICTAPKFKSALKPCYKILSTDVLPNILSYDNTTRMETACRGVRHYQVCVSKKLLDLCKRKPVYTDEMLYFKDKVPKLLMWTCSWTSMRGHCNEQALLLKMASCAFELQQSAVPTSYGNYSTSEQMAGCRAYTTYKMCLLNVTSETCKNNATIMQSKVVQHFTYDILKQYEHYCNYKVAHQELAGQISRCNEEALRIRYIECSQIISTEVIPYTDEPSDSPFLNDACKAVRKFQNCIAKIPTQDCSNGLKIPFSEESRYYIFVLKKKYEWVCSGNGDYMCNPEVLLLYLAKCEATFMKSHVRDYVDVDILSGMDCRDIQNYQWCLRNSIFESDCEYYQNILTSPEVLYFTDKLLRPYAKNCHVNLDCQIGSLYTELSECAPIIKVKVLPFVQEGWVQNPITACGGTREYQNCFRHAMQKTTCDKSAALFKLAEVQYYRNFLFNSYNWTCFEHAAPIGSCEKDQVLRDLQKCKSSIFDATSPVKPSSCSSLSVANYLSCTEKTNIKLACTADPAKVSDIAKHVRENLLDYRATCGFDQITKSLGTKFMKNEFDQCQIMLRKSDRVLKSAQIRETKVVDACRALQLFALCTESAIILSKNVADSQAVVEIRNASEQLTNSYKIKCAPHECNRKKIVEELYKCFLNDPVTSNCSLARRNNLTALAQPCLTKVFKDNACARKVDVVYVSRELFSTKVNMRRHDCNMLRSQYLQCNHGEFTSFLQKCYESFLREVTGRSIATPKFCRTYHKYGNCVDDASAETSCFNVTMLRAPYEASLRNFTSKYSDICTQYIRSVSNITRHSPVDKAGVPASAGYAFTSRSHRVVMVIYLALLSPLFLSSPFAYRIRL
ncbi:uncharacterized protein LOC115318895 [Ixodes scapularis]|uniref:uncharacterized protein LOC115318895 n=1 Tax=Ixodes scapularis TaxID=6945 RepID=UPI001C384563|nr:uncharacterized protein LOC115318895 [Ixodes scapularis]